MPEPEWTRIGTTSTHKDAFDTIDWVESGPTTYLLGKTDLFAEIYKVENSTTPGETNYACVPHVKQWPGKKLDGGVNARNKRTTVEQNWTENTFGGLEITDWGPTEPKTGSIDWSISLSAGSSGASGGVDISYQTPYISRKVTSEYNQTVRHAYTYPQSIIDPFDAEARNEIVDLKSVGEAWLDDEPQCSVPWYKPCPQELLGVHVASSFEGHIDNPDSGNPYYPKVREVAGSIEIGEHISLRSIDA